MGFMQALRDMVVQNIQAIRIDLDGNAEVAIFGAGDPEHSRADALQQGGDDSVSPGLASPYLISVKVRISVLGSPCNGRATVVGRWQQRADLEGLFDHWAAVVRGEWTDR